MDFETIYVIVNTESREVFAGFEDSIKAQDVVNELNKASSKNYIVKPIDFYRGEKS